MTDTTKTDTTPVTVRLAEFACRPGVVPAAELASRRPEVEGALTRAGHGRLGGEGAVDTVIALLVDRASMTPQWSALAAATALADPADEAGWAAAVLGSLVAVAGPATTTDELAEACVVGCEVAARVAAGFAAAGPSGWDVGVIAAVFGATAAVGRVFGFSPAEMVNAFGIAGAQSGGPAVLSALQTAPFVRARAAFVAVEACLLGRHGFIASERIIEGKGGVGEVQFADADYAGMIDQLGTAWTSGVAA